MELQTTSEAKGKFTLRAVRDFEPSQMNRMEKREFSAIFERLRDLEQFHNEQNFMQSRSELNQQQHDESERRKLNGIRSDTEERENEDKARIDNRSTPKNDLRTSDKVCIIQDQEEAITKIDWETVMDMVSKELMMGQVDMQNSSRFAECSQLEDNHSCETAIAFKTGDKMETIPPANIGDIDGWWLVKHLDNGNIGYIPRKCVVIDNARQPHDTTLNNLPLELQDDILEKSYLHWVLNCSLHQRDRDVIKSLASVDFCWFRRLQRRRFKKRIWNQLKAFYYKTNRRATIIRDNRNYFLENIHLNDQLILLLNGVTEERNQLNLRQRSERSNNDKLLYVIKSLDETKFSNFVRCLRQTKQKTSAKVLENGGGVIKIEVKSRVAKYVEIQKLHQTIEDFGNRAVLWSYQSDKLITELREEDIEILNSKLDNLTVVVWMWCRSQLAVENLHKLFHSNKLRDVLFGFANVRLSAPEIIHSIVINIDRNQFKKTVAMSSVYVNLIERITDESVLGITKLRNEIYVACRRLDHPERDEASVIRVFEDRNPFRLKKEIEKDEIGMLADIGSSEKDSCVYVCDYREKCIWKITKETDGEYTIIKWLTTEYKPARLSVTGIGNLLLINDSILMIYGSDAELVRSIQLPSEFSISRHAVETSNGNFIILHRVEEKKITWPITGVMESRFVVSELTSDGQMVVRRCISSDEEQIFLDDPEYLSLDSDEHVFLADKYHDGLTIFDSDLKWNPMLFPARTEEEDAIVWTQRVCYDEETKQLIVGGDGNGGIKVYSFSLK